MARYESPLTSRYASQEMAHTFSDDAKFSIWRMLWLNLAIAEKMMGLKEITDEMIQEMREHLTDIDYETAKKEEARRRHVHANSSIGCHGARLYLWTMLPKSARDYPSWSNFLLRN